MATKIVQDASLTAVAEAIREKGGTEALLEFPNDFVSAIEAIQSGGTGGITQDADGYLVLDSEAGGIDPFETYISFQLSGIHTIPNAGSLRGISLRYQNGISELYVPNSTYLEAPSSMFQEMTGLRIFSAPKAARTSANLLYGCTALTSVNLDALTDTSTNILYGCTSLPVVVLPSVNAIYSQTFRGCSNLETIDVLANTGFTNQNNMNGCTKLTKVIIRKNGVASLSNTNNFAGTPFANGGTGGEIYVPSAQIEAYKVATNWSTLHGYGTITWKSIEGSYYETHYADGRVIE